MSVSSLRRVPRAAVVAGAGAAVLLTASLLSAPTARADVPPLQVPSDSMVTADALPTAQIDGVAWAQAVQGNTVYVGGEFTTARPAGAAPRTQTVPRGNLMAYDLTTGVMTAWAPVADAQVDAVALSPDGKRLYVGGQFTKITEKVGSTTTTSSRYRLAAFDTATGRLIAGFQPSINYTVKSIVATNSTVYVGGAFAKVNNVARNRVAALRASDAGLLPFNPGADAQVNAMVLTPDRSMLILGGSFQNVAGGAAYGLAAVSSSTGALKPWQANTVVRNAGKNSAITSLTTDGTSIYGSGYVFGTGGNLEGAFKANPTTGAITWIEDCHGDTYGVYASSAAIYTAGHAHYCGNIGGFPQINGTWYRAIAFTPKATGTINHDPTNGSYHDWYGQKAPSLVTWFPHLEPGSYTGATQAAWTVTGSGKYVVFGGEFPTVNGVGQQGLVRFAKPAVAPNAVGPQVEAGKFVPTLTSTTAGEVTVSWTANYDLDDTELTYKVYRDSTGTGLVGTVRGTSTPWTRPTLSITDRGLTSGSKHGYRVFAIDPDGNTVRGNTVMITVR
ncbi:fibronectin type III domain-containing protein [Jatrophihabitans sp. YIM 134969]